MCIRDRDKTAEAAKLNACNNYCRDADPEFDAMYRIWLDSPKGKAAGSPSKQESIFKDKDLLVYVTETCAKKCVAAITPNGPRSATAEKASTSVGRSSRRRRTSCWLPSAPSSSRRSSPVPVSYTHLDVYKRQIMESRYPVSNLLQYLLV